ncbi:hypothetical protein Vadar_002211 [Vaccinium darrowii]|uniref:Uncharacterized protein n=1 Tax=Vaccinium darrowii TaxID=229202 RepID=A0ACB7WX83_9ERIC|nr:hypothetical protein Vadar_002211 [Vaccinium darrowii]
MKKLLPRSSPKNYEDGDDCNVEYSFAVEYIGPPLSHDIPLVLPIDIDQIPTASVVVTASSELGLIDVEEGIPEVSDGIDSSGTLEFFDSRDYLQELSVSSELEEGLEFFDSRDDLQELSESSELEEGLDDDGEVGLGLDEGELSSRALSPESLSIQGEEDCIEESPCHFTGTSVVTSSHELTDYYDQEIFQRRAIVKKGFCNRCNKRNRFAEKVVCIVCGAQYCSNCVVRAMGSMPEGRKCITCIGFPIDESKRGSLGKSSRILRQLFSDLEVNEIMRFEISCEANQLPPQLIYVNGKPLCHEELVALQMCRNPPKKLKPGRYWYDKVSGFWGKEGEKPCQIITAHLNVGYPIMLKASNGDTNIRINNREITKAELRMLQWAGIHCEGYPHFWVDADGSYQEEGQYYARGRIWEKAGIKIVCALLSLPIPPEDAKPSGEEVANTANDKTLNKLLLVGCDKSGTSTIFKQAKMVYNVPCPEDKRQNIKLRIQSNLYGYLGVLLEGRERFEEEFSMEMRRKSSYEPGPSRSCGQRNEKNIYSISPRLKAFSDWLLEVMISGNLDINFPAASREYAPLIEDLWKDKAFQATYDRRNELHMLPRIASYFLDRAVEISSTDYEPSDTDILYAEGITPSNGLSSMEFSFPKSTQDSFMHPADQNDSLHRYQLIRVHASTLGENCKWLEMFEDTDLVLYCVSLADFDHSYDNPDGVCSNKMLESKKLFESIVSHPTFHQKNFLLILNKFDLLEEKIEQIPLTQCEWFSDFNPGISRNQNSTSSSYANSSLAQHAFHYIAMKFKSLFFYLTGRKLYVSRVTGLELDCVDEALTYAREILKWEEEKHLFGIRDWFSCSSEESSSS